MYSLRGPSIGDMTTIMSMQERDGYSEQLVSLRDKISKLSRELAEGEEGGRAKGQRIADLQAELQNVQQAAQEAASVSAQRIQELQRTLEEAEQELSALKRTHKQDMARLCQACSSVFKSAQEASSTRKISESVDARHLACRSLKQVRVYIFFALARIL
jgi:chromosome segregation ATPase